MPRPLSKPQNRKEALAADLRSSSRLIVQLENALRQRLCWEDRDIVQSL